MAVTISVVIPVYNSASFIENTLLSVHNQTIEPIEIIIIDDGSTDRSIDIIKDFVYKSGIKNVRVIQTDHLGPGAARNRGVIESHGEWIAFLDSDDIWMPHKLEKVTEYISSNIDADLICHSEIWRKLTGEETPLEYYKRYNPDNDPFLFIYHSEYLSTSAVTVRRSKLFDAGLFDESLPSSQDYDLWIRISLVAKFGFIEEPLGFYITREGNISENIQQRLRCLIKIADKYSKWLPYLEVIKRKSSIYASIGIEYIRRHKYLKGAFYLLKGFIKYPLNPKWMRWIKKIEK